MFHFPKLVLCFLTPFGVMWIPHRWFWACVLHKRVFMEMKDEIIDAVPIRKPRTQKNRKFLKFQNLEGRNFK